MLRFGVICEGVCDRKVLENLLIGFVGGAEEPALNPIQPPEASAQEASPAGGWTLVLAALADGRHEEALAFNDYVLIQIDTDCAGDKGFDVSTAGLEVDAVRARVIERLTSEMGQPSFDACKERLLFAITIDAIECWLLPLVIDPSEKKKAAKTTGCIAAVNQALKLKKEDSLKGTSSAEKDPRRYDEVSKPWRKGKQLRADAPRNPSLKLFIDELGAKVSLPD